MSSKFFSFIYVSNFSSAKITVGSVVRIKNNLDSNDTSGQSRKSFAISSTAIILICSFVRGRCRRESQSKLSIEWVDMFIKSNYIQK